MRNGNILVRQVGLKIAAGDNVGVGKDFTLYSLKDGVVGYKLHRGKRVAYVTPSA